MQVKENEQSRREAWLADSEGAANLELKFVLPMSRVAAALSQLASRLEPDGEYPDNEIAGIYFDTAALAALEEKLAGDNEKRKIRLRWYEDPAGARPRSRVFLESKERRGRSRQKRRGLVDLDLEAWLGRPLEDPAWIDLPRRLVEADWRVPAGLVPTVRLRYRRRRFVDRASGARVALDAEIRAERHHRGLFPGLLVPARVEAAVVEVKDVAEVPPVLGFLPALGARYSAYSKYSACLGLH